jgi:hypothetical protein
MKAITQGQQYQDRIMKEAARSGYIINVQIMRHSDGGAIGRVVSFHSTTQHDEDTYMCTCITPLALVMN